MHTLTIQRHFWAGHAIRLPDGSLEPPHNHNWPVEITLGCTHLDAIDTVTDFHPLEALVDALLAPWCNKLLNHCPPFADPQGHLVINPTAERIAQAIGEALILKLPEPDRLHLISVTLGEAPGCKTTWRPEKFEI